MRRLAALMFCAFALVASAESVAQPSRLEDEAAETRLYRPATKNGKPVEVQFKMRFDFRI